MGQGFSFASIILSYFLVGGGMFSATLVAIQLQVGSEIAMYGALAIGAFVGGFVAARASPGETILEPAIGAVAVIATIVGLAAGTSMGQQLWASAHDETMKFVGAVGLSSVVGAVIGAFLAERLLGEATRSSIPWLVYTALSVFGASLLATLLGSIFLMQKHTAEVSDTDSGLVMVVSIGAGCLVAGFAVGASARVRPLLAAFFGGGIGVAGYVMLVLKLAAAAKGDALAGMAVMAVGGALVTLLGTAIGWAMVGRKNVAGPNPSQLARQFQ